MDGITRETLEQELAGLINEEAKARDRYQQIVGARQMVAALLRTLDEPKLASTDAAQDAAAAQIKAGEPV